MKKCLLILIISSIIFYLIIFSCTLGYLPEENSKRNKSGNNTSISKCNTLSETDNPNIMSGTGQLEMQGFADAAGFGEKTTTGGEGGPLVTVTSAEEFISNISRDDPCVILVDGIINLPEGIHYIKSDKSILGISHPANINYPASIPAISGGILSIGSDSRGRTAKNIIIRNIRFTDVIDRAAVIQNSSHHIWIDHCEFDSGQGGILDISAESNYITLSWNRYNSLNCSQPLIKISDAGGKDKHDKSRLKLTLCYSSFYGSNQESPFIIAEEAELVHIFSNYFSGNGYGFASNENAGVFIEECGFYNIMHPGVSGLNDNPGRIFQRNNHFYLQTDTEFYEYEGDIVQNGFVVPPSRFYIPVVCKGDNIKDNWQMHNIVRSFTRNVKRDKYEDDNAISEAKDIALDEKTEQSFHHPYDIDCLKFNAVRGFTYIITTKPVSGWTKYFNIDLALHTEDNEAIINDNAEKTHGKITWTCSRSGDYYLKARPHDSFTLNDTVGTYSIALELHSDIAADIYEPDNNFNEAKITGINIPQNRTIHRPNNADFIKFNCLSGYTVKISCSSADNLDTEIALFDPDGRLIDRNNDYAGFQPGLTWSCMVSGTYYIKVNSHEFEACGDYTIEVRLISMLPDSPDIYEPDNDFNGASMIKELESQDHTLHNSSDTDFVKFEALNGYVYFIKASAGASGLNLTLFDSNGITEISSIVIPPGNEDGIPFPAYELPVKTLYAKISCNDGNTPCTYSTNLWVEDLPVQDEAEPNDAMDQAKEIYFCNQAEFTLHSPADKDYYKLWGVEGNTYRIEPAWEISIPIDMTVYDKNGVTILASNADSNPAVEFECFSSGYYYLLIKGQEPGKTYGSYNIWHWTSVDNPSGDEYEVDDSQNQCSTISVFNPDPVIHTIHVLGDIDFFGLEYNMNEPFTITVTADAGMDIEIYLYDNYRNIIAGTNDLGKTSASITYAVPDDGSGCHLLVRGYHDSFKGSYTVAINPAN